MQSCDLAFTQGGHYLGNGAFLAHNAEGGQTDIADAVFAVHHGGNGHGGVDTVQNGFTNMADRGADRIIGSTLAFDHAGAAAANISFNFLKVHFGIVTNAGVEGLTVLTDGYIGNIGK